MARHSSFEHLPVEIVEQCLQGLPIKTLAVLLGLSRKTRELVIVSLEFMFSKLVKAYLKEEKYLGLEAIHTSLSVTARSELTFSNFVSVTKVTTVAKHPLRYARFELKTPMDITSVNTTEPVLFTCSAFRNTTDEPCENFFEDLAQIGTEPNLSVDPDGMLVNSQTVDSKRFFKTIDINPFKVIALNLDSNR